MRVRILGTAAGGGLPQWNCGCASCTRARAGGTTRTQDGLAVSGDGTAWYLVNASPDLRTQLLRAPEFTPPAGTRDSPLRGVLFTSAELDHTLGLLTLREATRLSVYATAPVRAALPGPILDAYTRVDWHTVRPGTEIALDGELRATAFPLSTKRPRYAAALEDGDWTIGYRFTAPSGGVLVYAPGLATITDTFTAAVKDADVVLLDGTFATDGELPGRTAREMGHLPVEDSLPFLRAHPGPRYLYTHLNNTNSLAGEGIAEDGRWLEL